MSYEKTIYFNGHIDKAFELAQNTFLPLGFSINSKTTAFLESSSPGSLWTHGQNPFYSISKITINTTDNELSIIAELGGLKKSIIYLIIFLVSLCLSLSIIFAIIFNKQEAAKFHNTIAQALSDLAEAAKKAFFNGLKMRLQKNQILIFKR